MSPHFFKREADGSVRLRIRFTPEEAAAIEEAAGETPLLLYIHRVLAERAKYHIRKREEVERARMVSHKNGLVIHEQDERGDDS
jgi:serine acetyltransferase